MKPLLMMLMTISFTLPITVSAAEGYICISEQSTGFAYNKTQKKWFSTEFTVDGEKFLLSEKDGKWTWKKFGGKGIDITCGEFNEYGYISCSLITSVEFNKKNLRFMTYYPFGYVSGGIAGTEGGDTPNITIGTCSPL